MIKPEITRAKSDQLHCLECSGGSSKEVTLCMITSCSKWAYRFGYSTNDKRYDERMLLAAERWPKEYEELMRLRAESLAGSISASSPQMDMSLDDNDDEDEGL